MEHDRGQHHNPGQNNNETIVHKGGPKTPTPSAGSAAGPSLPRTKLRVTRWTHPRMGPSCAKVLRIVQDVGIWPLAGHLDNRFEERHACSAASGVGEMLTQVTQLSAWGWALDASCQSQSSSPKKQGLSSTATSRINSRLHTTAVTLEFGPRPNGGQHTANAHNQF